MIGGPCDSILDNVEILETTSLPRILLVSLYDVHGPTPSVQSEIVVININDGFPIQANLIAKITGGDGHYSGYFNFKFPFSKNLPWSFYDDISHKFEGRLRAPNTTPVWVYVVQAANWPNSHTNLLPGIQSAIVEILACCVEVWQGSITELIVNMYLERTYPWSLKLL